MATVVIYPGFDAFYYSFYIKGLIETFGESNIRFSSSEFPKITSECLSFIVRNGQEKRIVVDAYDGQITPRQHNAIQWCDVFGKVNLRSSVVAPEFLPKCLAIGPSFPIRVWPGPKSWRRSIGNYRPGIQGIKLAREHFANYARQYKYRLDVDSYVPGTSRDNYVFFSATIWREDEAPNTNQHRATFMSCCKAMNGVTFEGGFSPTDETDRAAPYREHMASRRYPLPEWLEKIQHSAIAFNTPAVWQSHTFKLAEFLALGKAIISIPLVNDMPAPLVHGEHVHYVDGSEESFKAAIQKILKDHDYRKRLEQNAYAYYKNLLTPGRVIQRLMEFKKA